MIEELNSFYKGYKGGVWNVEMHNRQKGEISLIKAYRDVDVFK